MKYVWIVKWDTSYGQPRVRHTNSLMTALCLIFKLSFAGHRAQLDGDVL